MARRMVDVKGRGPPLFHRETQGRCKGVVRQAFPTRNGGRVGRQRACPRDCDGSLVSLVALHETAPPAPAIERPIPCAPMDDRFREAIAKGYTLDEPHLVLGSALLGDEVLTEPRIAVALSMLNRHGLIAGATGTGKTKTLQLMAGQLSDAGVPVFVADVKGDLTGLAAPGAGRREGGRAAESLGWDHRPQGHPVEFLSLSGALGAQVRATVHSFGPLLLGKVLDLNETQTAVLSLVFKYCDDNALPLLDLADLRDHAVLADVRRGQGRDEGVRRHCAGDGGRDPALDRDPRAGGRRHLLRRARVRRGRPDARDARGAA